MLHLSRWLWHSVTTTSSTAPESWHHGSVLGVYMAGGVLHSLANVGLCSFYFRSSCQISPLIKALVPSSSLHLSLTLKQSFTCWQNGLSHHPKSYTVNIHNDIAHSCHTSALTSHESGCPLLLLSVHVLHCLDWFCSSIIYTRFLPSLPNYIHPMPCLDQWILFKCLIPDIFSTNFLKVKKSSSALVDSFSLKKKMR